MEVNVPKNPTALAVGVSVAAKYNCSGKLIDQDTLKYSIDLLFYVEGSDPLNPDENNADKYKTIINLTKKN